MKPLKVLITFKSLSNISIGLNFFRPPPSPNAILHWEGWFFKEILLIKDLDIFNLVSIDFSLFNKLLLIFNLCSSDNN